MIILDVNKLGINFGYGELLKEVSFSLNEGESISIVGPNGCRKSTVLKMIAGLEKQDAGQVSIKKDAKVAYLDQTGSSVQDDRTCLEILKAVFQDLNEMENKIEILQKRLESDLEENEYQKVLKRYCDLMEEYSDKRWI
ncbi:MAG: ABC-F family ATP-binding cassette domain-containing protein [Clostridia bacterium]|nr:ABC-F family ATP-binding cassette domain-containing protein [Clostridia bacterium]